DLVLGRLLPALVSRAGADQVDVGAEVLTVLAGAVAGAVGAEAEVLGRELVEFGVGSGKEVSSLKSEATFPRIGLLGPPQLLPFFQAFRTARRLWLEIDPPTHGDIAGGKDVSFAPPFQ